MNDSVEYVSQLAKLRFCHIRFHLRATKPVTFHGDLSSMIRGSLGWALKEVSCIRTCYIRVQDHMKVPKDCGVSRCPFRRIFLAEEWPRYDLHVLPKNYRIIAPRYEHAHTYHAGEILYFDLLLFGDGIADAPLWILAALKAGARGLGRKKVPFRLQEVHDIFTNDLLWTLDHTTPPIVPSSYSLQSFIPFYSPYIHSISLSFYTPLILRNSSLKEGSDELPALSILIKSALRRTHALMCSFEHFVQHRFISDEIELFASAEVSGSLHAHHQMRYSASQRNKIPQFGMMGTLHYVMNEYAEWVWMILHMGSIVGIGNQTILGFGGFEIHTESSILE